MSRRLLLLLGLVMLIMLGTALPGLAKQKVPDVDPTGLGILMGSAPTPASAATPAPVATPAPALPAQGGLTADRFLLGFGLIVIGTLGAALAVLALRRARRTVAGLDLQPRRDRRP